MGKIINAYRGYTATDVKNKATSGVSGTMTVAGSTVDCTNITVTGIKTAIAESVNSVGSLCSSNKVNRWSGYSPILRSTSGSGYNTVLVNSAPSSNFQMGSFAGYNHSAPTPGWATNGQANATADVWINSGTKATLISDLVIGELLYENAGGVLLVAYNDSQVPVAYGEEPLSGLKETANLSAESIDNISVQQTWTLRNFIKNNNIISGINDISGAIMYRVPNVSDVSVTIKIKTLSTWYYGATGTQTLPSPWTQASSAGMNWTTGYFDIGSIEANATYNNFRVYVTMYNWLNEVVGTADLFNGNYTPYYDITGSVYLGMTNIPNYGYRVVVQFEEES
jgi:hypothetical protein